MDLQNSDGRSAASRSSSSRVASNHVLEERAQSSVGGAASAAAEVHAQEMHLADAESEAVDGASGGPAPLLAVGVAARSGPEVEAPREPDVPEVEAPGRAQPDVPEVEAPGGVEPDVPEVEAAARLQEDVAEVAALARPEPHVVRVPAGGRMDMRGKLTLSAVHKNGVQIGWGANCGMCHSDVVRAACKKQLPYGGRRSLLLNDDQCRRKLKKWLTLHVEAASREEHVAMDARSLPLESEEALDATLAVLREVG